MAKRAIKKLPTKASPKKTAPIKPQNLKKYLVSKQDKREDKAMSKIVGMKTSAFKKTPQSKTIDKAVVSLNKK